MPIRKLKGTFNAKPEIRLGTERLRGRTVTLALCSAFLLSVLPVLAQSTGSLRGLVTDPTGAVIPAATVAVRGRNGKSRTVASNALGEYHVDGLAPGGYTVTASAKGFASFEKQSVTVPPGGTVRLNIRLAIASTVQNVQVQANGSQLQVAPDSNASAVVISGSALDALSNDPDELLSQIQALAGPSVGSAGANIYIDGFTGGDMPPKSSIRSIRVNSNPFSAENNRLGYGRIDITTKPGGEQLHGNFSLEYNNSAMNARSRFLNGVTLQPYHTWLLGGDLSGPLGKNASFFFDVQRRNINRANLVNTDVLDPNLNIVPFKDSVPNPHVLTSFSPRVDLQLSKSNTLALRYRYFEITHTNDGVDTQALPSQAYNRERHHHDLRFIDTQVLGPNAVNTTSFQLLHFHNLRIPQNFSPTLEVLGAFTGGGDTSGSFNRYETHYQLADDAEITRGQHLFRFGGRMLVLPRRENTNGNFNGTFTFNSLADYQKTEQALRNGMTISQIQAAGYGPSQFTITTGSLVAAITRLNAAAYLNDDWKITSQFTASMGMRVESETDISEPLDWGPRLGFAWGLGRGTQTKTVLRGGFGIFYQHFDDDEMMIAERQNGTNQLTYIVRQPDFYPTIPTIATIRANSTSAPTVYRVSPHLHFPADVDGAISAERQVAKNVTASVTWLHSRGYNQFLSNDINAPLPGTYNPGNPTSGERPVPGAGNIYSYQSRADYRQTEIIANVHVNAARAAIFGYYVWNNAHSDTAGADSFPADPWNIRADYGPSQYDIRDRAVIGGTYALPRGLRLSSLIMANSGQPFSINVPQDVYGTGVHNARPAPVTASTPPANIVNTRFGSFDMSPSPGEAPIPPNTETGPSGFMLNLRVDRTFGFGGETRGQRGGTGGAPEAHHWHHNGGLGGRGLSGQGGGAHLQGATNQRFALTVSASALNLLNNVNLGQPVSVLGSPLFGQSISLATGAYAAQVGNPVANRLVNVGMELNF